MKLEKQPDDMNVVPHPALTLVTRHNFGTPKDEIKVIPSRVAKMTNLAYYGIDLRGLDADFDVVEIDAPSATSVGYAGGVHCNTLRMRLPRYTTITPPYLLYPLKCKRLEVELGSLKNLLYLVNNAGMPWATLEELEMTGVGYATQAMYSLNQQTRLWHLRIDSLANMGLMTAFGLNCILDKPSILHLRDVILKSSGSGALGIGVADGYQQDVDVIAALNDIRSRRTTTVRYNPVPYDLRDKVYRIPPKTE